MLKYSTNKQQKIMLFLLILICFALYRQVVDFSFLNYDDPLCVTDNPMVEKGLTLKGILYAFTDIKAANWYPVTLLSHMTDCALFGMDPGLHHLMNLFLHLANMVLLFLAFYRMTGEFWPCFFIAALFAVHPLHVESMAWIAERKDLLSTFFALAALIVYIDYTKQPRAFRYFACVVLYSLGLMAKPMVVTFPFLMILLDIWPLKRVAILTQFNKRNQAVFVRALLRSGKEKIPFFFLSAAVSIVAIYAQKKAGAVASVAGYPFYGRVLNAALSYWGYITKTFWPFDLAVFYPYPGHINVPAAAGPCLFLIAVTILAVKLICKYPFFAVGWFWYLGTLVPVIGLVQVGMQGMADRYSYLPIVGIFIILGWGYNELERNMVWKRPRTFFSGFLALSCLAAAAWVQAGYWKNSTTLFEHAIHVTKGNYLAHKGLGGAFMMQGRKEEALKQFALALKFKHDYAGVYLSTGQVMASMGRLDEAEYYFRQGLRYSSKNPDLHYDYANLLARKGRLKESLKQMLTALKLKPESADIHNNLGAVFQRIGFGRKAMDQYKEAVSLDPEKIDAVFNLAQIYEINKMYKKAADHYRSVLKIDPLDEESAKNLKKCLEKIKAVGRDAKQIHTRENK